MRLKKTSDCRFSRLISELVNLEKLPIKLYLNGLEPKTSSVGARPTQTTIITPSCAITNRSKSTPLASDAPIFIDIAITAT